MAESSAGGALVPAVKSELPSTSETPPPPDTAAAAMEKEEDMVELDRDTLCPICMQTMKDAFLTACGHSFCYMCIFTHLKNKRDCPCCGYYLTSNHIFPNLLLNKLLKKTSARLTARTASPVENLRLALQQTGL